ncbi:arylsulfatase A-like enzyme [Algoriphagus iocasae]|uniref:Arylsulfatase A-like enzyme n=1 Tax=Algoriphagus iocasae TaxID=1836499 RepID=A0A841MT52_9BACT|nr:sulfatase [Algoriphagus iocasae]MBB6328929.1 arylsulfatase A-like enzyme [Algoriphagus iocasae]
MKRIFLVLSLIGLVALPAFPQDFNVLIIHVDDLGWADIEPLGSDFYETPHINRLASEGILFTNSYAAAAICSPTRAAMLTGKYPARLGITDWIRAKFQGVTTSGLPREYEVFEDKPLKTPKIQGFLPLEEVTIAERMKGYGYETLHVGKWHLGEEGFYPTDQGFDVNIGGNDLGQPPSYFDPYLPAQPRDFYEITTLKPRKEGEFLTDREGDEVVDYIRSKKEKKFFIHWAPYAVHTPIMGKPDLVEKYKQKEPGNQRNPEYAALVESVDQNVGKVIEALDKLGLREKTLVIFTSDNGGLIWDYENPITNNYPLKSQKGYPYEGGIRVPTIVSWPGKLPMGALSESPIITMDWIPTILDFMGENPVQEGLEGISLKPILENPSQKVDRDLFWHFPHYRLNDIVPYAIVRSGDYKLIHYFDGSQDELYNLDFDMEEKVNVISTRKAIADQLQIKLEKWLEETGARLPVEK